MLSAKKICAWLLPVFQHAHIDPEAHMSKLSYSRNGTQRAEQLIEDLFALGAIGYVALGCGQDVLMRIAPETHGQTQTTADSNFFEELLVNPTLLKLASQRGNLDCGGLAYVAIGYSDFVQFIALTMNGHLSLGVARTTHVAELANKVQRVLERHQMTPEKARPSLFSDME